MRCLLMANGIYGDITIYYELAHRADLVVCADGGANFAYQMGVTPDCIVGDLDSIRPEVKEYFAQQGVRFIVYPAAKDFTDFQLALKAAEEMGADEIILVGTLGGRLDHTLANLYICIDAVEKGRKIIHFGPDVTIYLVNSRLRLQGRVGDLVSVMALAGKVSGITLEGFAFPLEEAELYPENPIGVSNRMTAETVAISVGEGIVAIFHYQ